MDAVRLFLLWLALKVRSAIVIYLSFTLLAFLIELMNKVTETAQEVLANPKTTGTIATAGSGTVLYDSFVDAAPDILIILSILATILTIWAHFTARKRHKRQDAIREAEAAEQSQVRQLEIAKLQQEIAEKNQAIKEAEVRTKAAELFFDHMKKKDPEMAESIEKAMDDRIIDFACRSKVSGD